ncbi:MAG TPA: HEAT repeat domain-containing protein [Planctomycetota bacterium]|nr:HEAT repeat domain-containing protein [Planctomycetota bacterium]
MRRGLLLIIPFIFGAALARGDEGANAQRLAALVDELKNPDGFRAAYKLVDAGADAVPLLLSKLGANALSDERIELCLREIARTRDGARQEIQKLGVAGFATTRARLARALAGAGALDAVYPLVDALDNVQEPLEVNVFGPQGTRPLDSVKVEKPVTSACALFGEKATAAIQKRLQTQSSPLFRIEAMAVLAIVKNPKAAPDAAKVAEDDKRPSDERAAALAALAAMKSPLGKPLFATALGADDSGLRRAGARGLAAVPDPGAVPSLARLLDEEKDDDVKLEAVRALSVLEDPLAGPPLRSVLEAATAKGGPQSAVLLATCASGIATCGDRPGIADIVKLFDLGLGFPVERPAAQALARIPDLGYEPRERLRAIADDKTFPPIARACVCWVLACRGEDAPLATLLELAKHKDAVVRVSVAQLLAERKLDGAVPVLEALCADPNVTVRRAAVLSLGRSEASIAGAALVRAARQLDQDPVVRKLYASAYVDALAQGTLDDDTKKGGRALISHALETNLKDATISERRAQASTLSRLGERAALLRIATAALATDELPLDSRRASVEVLGRLGRNEQVENALASLVKDPALGDDAAVALARMRNETFFEPTWRERLAPAAPYR